MDAALKLLGVMSGDHRYELILADPEQKGEVKTMDDALTRVINEGRAEERIELLVSLCKAGHISIDIAAAQMHVSTDEFQKYLDNDAAVSD